MKRPFCVILVIVSSLVGLMQLTHVLQAAPAVAAPAAALPSAAPKARAIIQAASFPLHVNYAHNWISGDYPLQHTVYLTVTDPAGHVKAYGAVQTLAGGSSHGGDGFFAGSDSDWFPTVPDLAPGDWVYASVLGTADAASLQIGAIDGLLDVAADAITVSIDAPWLLPGIVNVDCHPWGAPGGAPGYNFFLRPDGGDRHVCRWDPQTEWDIVPGQDLAVEYYLPDRSSIQNVFRLPAPSVSVFQDNAGTPAESGNYRFTIAYSNWGDGPAENVVVDSLFSPADLAFLTYTAPFTHVEVAPGLHRWQLGTLPANADGKFDVYMQVLAPNGQLITHTARITTSNPYNTSYPWDVTYPWSDFVAVNAADARAMMYAQPFDPPPGGTMTFLIDACNWGATSSGWVTLTGTLPLSTTALSWWSSSPGWSGALAGSTVVLTKPTLGDCETIHVDALVDAAAPLGGQLAATAVLTTAVDTDPANNTASWFGTTALPYDDLYVYHNYLANPEARAPGGKLTYYLSYGSVGNVPLPGARLTYTLPASTTFAGAWRVDPNAGGGTGCPPACLRAAAAPAVPTLRGPQPPITPVISTTGYVVFDLGPLAAGAYADMGVSLRVDWQAPAGLVLTNTVEISQPPGEIFPFDNANTVTDTFNADVWVYKTLGACCDPDLLPGMPLTYVITFGNRGAGDAVDVSLDDALPAELDFQSASLTPTFVITDPLGDWVSWVYPLLPPGAQASIILTATLDPAPVPPLILNYASVYQNWDPLGGDNVAYHALYSVTADLRLDKSASAAQLPAGQPLTYTLDVLNQGPDVATGVQITDYLPANVTLVPGSLSGSGPLTCQLLGQMVSCTAVSLPANQPEVVRFAVIPNNPGPLFNHAAIQAAEPDANTVNNADSTTTLVGGTGVDVGVQKTAAQAIIPLGQPLTYTLDIFNNSNANATGVVVTDTLPASMAFNGTATSTGALSCQLVAQQVVCDLPLLPAGQQEQIHIFVTPTLTGTFTNVADIRAAEPDPFPFNNSDSAVTLVIAPQTPTVDLHLEKTVSAAAAVLDMPFTYTLSLRNNGPDPATGVVVTDTLPANVLLVSATSTSGLFSCQPAAVGVVCQTAVLDPGIADTIQLRVVAGLPGPALNFARTAAAELDLQPGNNADSVYTLITASSDPGLFDITPGSGANTGPTPVTVRGFNFEPASQLYLSRLGQRFPLSGMQFVDAFTLRGTAPAGLAPGVYNLLVENSDGSQARLLDAFIVYGGGPPVVTAVSPPSGPDNRPMRIDIAGSNFARPVLAALSDGSTLYPLGGVDVLHDGRVQATVPISLTPGVYDVVIRNPNQLSGTLPAAYTVLDATLLDDLFGFAYEFGTRPASPIVGQNTELGFYVYRQGGQQPLSDVEVAFYDGPPAQAGSSLIAQVIIPTLAPNARVPLTTTWTPAAAGLHTLHVVVDPTDGVPESDEQNNTYAHPVFVRPAPADGLPPQVTAFTIDGGALSTNQRQVVLDTTATDNVGVAYLLFIEYIFSQNADSWLPVQASGWLTHAGAHAAHEWRLAPWPGAHYLQVWAADAAGNVSPRPGQALINAWPVDTDIPIGHAQGHVFRWPLQAGEGLQVHLTIVSGDADVYVWDAAGNLLATSQLEEPVDEVVFTAPADGVYQIEVTGAEDAVYRLAIVPGSGPAAAADDRGHVKGRGAPYGGVGNDPPDNPSLPTLPRGAKLVYLPLLFHAP